MVVMLANAFNNGVVPTKTSVWQALNNTHIALLQWDVVLKKSEKVLSFIGVGEQLQSSDIADKAAHAEIDRLTVSLVVEAQEKKYLAENRLEAIYCEAIGMVEHYQQAIFVANLGGIARFSLKSQPQKFPSGIPLISKDGLVHEEHIEKMSVYHEAPSKVQVPAEESISIEIGV
ncbi:hypothetical protein CTI12_AA576140 [Artemisia annua]|uniref:Uncharacterized protein n=1 Tax=Artemisia annua TaxID=35608 RepID=A0A2U1KQI6_ARTAN|nr:hypothetical protein CTI12_AA576140 [Artemisia annua]